MNEYELLYRYRTNPSLLETIIEKYKHLMYGAIHQVCYNFDQFSFTPEDVYQEALINLERVIDAYRPEKEASFSSYLYKCTVSSARLLIRKHRSLSYGLLDRCYSLNSSINGDGTILLGDLVCESKVWYQPEPLNSFVHLYKNVLKYIETLKPLEQKVFYLRNDGSSYQEISKECQISTKKVDNILQKIRRHCKELE